jgi:hypothetical protein
VAQLPLREGGLGLLPQLEIAQIAHDASITTAIADIAKEATARETLLRYAGSRQPSEAQLVEDLRLHHFRSLDRVALALGETRIALDAKPRLSKGLQRQMTTQWGEEQWLELFLRQTSRTAQHRLADQSARLARAWMCGLPNPSFHHMDDHIALLALRRKLDVDLAPYGLEVERGACRVCPGGWCPDHALACRNNGGAAMARHEAAKDTLVGLWRQAGCTVTAEYRLPEPEDGWGAGDERQSDDDGGGADEGRRVDFRVEDRASGSTHLYDVTFCAPKPRTLGNNPDAPITRETLEAQIQVVRQLRARGQSSGTAKQQDGGVAREAAVELLVGPALRAAEDRKRRRYQDAVNHITPNSQLDTAPVVFVPLVFSSAGTYTPAVGNMLRQLVDAVTKLRQQQAGALWSIPSKAHFQRTVLGSLSRQLQSTTALFFGGGRSDH